MTFPTEKQLQPNHSSSQVIYRPTLWEHFRGQFESEFHFFLQRVRVLKGNRAALSRGYTNAVSPMNPATEWWTALNVEQGYKWWAIQQTQYSSQQAAAVEKEKRSKRQKWPAEVTTIAITCNFSSNNPQLFDKSQYFYSIFFLCSSVAQRTAYNAIVS